MNARAGIPVTGISGSNAKEHREITALNVERAENMKQGTFNAIACSLLTLACLWGCLPQSSEPMALASPRSRQWPKVRAAYLAKHPKCEACGGREGLQVHHVLPVRAAGNEDADGDGITNELDPDNLVTLCTGGTLNCHLWIGHAGNFKTYNPCVREDAPMDLEVRR